MFIVTTNKQMYLLPCRTLLALHPFFPLHTFGPSVTLKQKDSGISNEQTQIPRVAS